MSYFLVTELPGPAWDRSRPRREQSGFEQHAAFIDSLVDEGAIVVGGPLGDPDFGPAVLVFSVESEGDVRKRLADDPWTDTILTVERVQPWSIWVGSLID